MWVLHRSHSKFSTVFATMLLALSAGLAGCDQEQPEQESPLQSAQEVLELRAPNCGQPDSCTSVEIRREVFANQPALNAAVKKALLVQLRDNDESSGSDGVDDFEQLAREFIREAEKVSEISVAKWQLRGEAEMLDSSGNLLTVKISSYVYSGGAHGMPANQWLNWDLAENKKIVLADVIEPGKEQAFWDLAVKAHQDWLDTQGVNEDFKSNWPFQRSENFRISEKGLILLYGVYTLAPYAMGEVELTLPREKLGGIIREAYLPKI